MPDDTGKVVARRVGLIASRDFSWIHELVSGVSAVGRDFVSQRLVPRERVVTLMPIEVEAVSFEL